MNSQEFRAAPELVAEAKKIFSSATFRAILLALDAESPHRQPVNSLKYEGVALLVTNKQRAALQLGRISGWEECMRALLELADPLERTQQDDVPPTYTDSTPTEEQNGN